MFQANIVRVPGIAPCHYEEMPSQEFLDQIKTLMKEQNLTQTDLGDIVWPGVSTRQSRMSAVLRGTRRLTVPEYETLRRFFGLEDEPLVQVIPVIGLAAAGAWNEAILLPTRNRLIPKGLAGERAFGVEIIGDSMNMLLPEGGWAVVDPEQTHLYAGKVYLLQNGDHEATVKRYMGDPARFEPVSTNPAHQPLYLANTSFQVIGRVVSYGNDQGL